MRFNIPYCIIYAFSLFLASFPFFVLAEVPSPLEGRAEVNWRLGQERSILMTEFWVPLVQGHDHVLFGDLRLMGDDQDNR